MPSFEQYRRMTVILRQTESDALDAETAEIVRLNLVGKGAKVHRVCRVEGGWQFIGSVAFTHVNAVMNYLQSHHNESIFTFFIQYMNPYYPEGTLVRVLDGEEKNRGGYVSRCHFHEGVWECDVHFWFAGVTHRYEEVQLGTWID